MQSRLLKARQLVESHQVLQGESQYAAILKDWPECLEACIQLARFAMDRADPTRAANLLERARQLAPEQPQLAVNLGFAYAHSGRPAGARKLMEETIAQFPDFHPAWLLLSQIHDLNGDRASADRALFHALHHAQQKGQWMGETSTPPALLKTIAAAADRVRAWRRELLFSAFASVREQFGNDDLRRVDRALSGYLLEWDATPADPRQRPKFFFFPDIPSTPYLDPYLQPWATQLAAAYPEIRAEAAALIAEQVQLSGFLNFKEGDPVEKYLSGTSNKPAWDAFFFYRRGTRFDENHARCPKTSALLESIELCRVRDQAPEICFSVLTPGSHIMPHHGVTNTRVVVHLPLIVPGDCALNIVDGDAHYWKEGELMMFDDTYQHEAWNKSDQTRVILLMDAWNPHLTAVEKQAVKLLVEAISTLESTVYLS